MKKDDFFVYMVRRITPMILATIVTAISITFMSQFLIKDFSAFRKETTERDAFFSALEIKSY